MRTMLGTDQARPCWRCNSTIASYTYDDQISLVTVRCASCHAPDAFYPRNTLLTPPTAAEISAAHRECVP